MKLLSVVVLLSLTWRFAPAFGADEYRYPAAGERQRALVIYGTTDIDSILPVLRDFQRSWPDIELRYTHFITREMYERFRREADGAGGSPADIVLSSAMDLQVKLVNDGYAAKYVSTQTRALPSWARWRDEAFAFTHEPAVLVYNPTVLRPEAVPHTRFDLMALLRNPAAKLRGRVGTYDLVSSAVGYLLATQDARQSQLSGALMGELGDAEVSLEGTTARLLERLESGELALLYNVLGSYAQARADAGARLKIVLLEDYTLVVSHTAFIARRAAHPDTARLFLDYLLSQRGQDLLVRESRSFSLRPDVGSPFQSAVSSTRLIAPLRPIPLGPGLLVYLDTLKSQQFLRTWLGSMHKQ